MVKKKKKKKNKKCIDTPANPDDVRIILGIQGHFYIRTLPCNTKELENGSTNMLAFVLSSLVASI
jgi:hypothetical protein